MATTTINCSLSADSRRIQIIDGPNSGITIVELQLNPANATFEPVGEHSVHIPYEIKGSFQDDIAAL